MCTRRGNRRGFDQIQSIILVAPLGKIVGLNPLLFEACSTVDYPHTWGQNFRQISSFVLGVGGAKLDRCIIRASLKGIRAYMKIKHSLRLSDLLTFKLQVYYLHQNINSIA